VGARARPKAERSHGAGCIVPQPFLARSRNLNVSEEMTMSKGMDQKREQKRKPAKTLEEKRAAKKAKRADRAAGRSA
jgi:hypothetical protein